LKREGRRMVYIGIDISSEKFDVAFYDPKANKYTTQVFRQSKKGFKKFLSKLENLHEEVSIAMESTGIYDNNLFEFLNEQGYEVVLFHPYSVKNFLKSYSNSKTDEIDARNLALALFVLGDKAVFSTTLPKEILSLRKLVRFRSSIVREQTRLQIQLRNILKVNMPEILQFFKEMNSVVLTELLSRYPSRESILQNREGVVELLSSFRRWSRKKAEELVKSLEDSIGLTDKLGVDSTMVSTIVTQMKTVRKSIEKVEKEIERINSSLPENPISTIPGMGKVTKVTIISEIGEIDRFKTKEKFVAFLGMDPVIKQSGKSYRTSGISKKGNRNLRMVFYNLAIRAIKLIPKYRKKYKELRKRKPPKVAIIAIARKMAELVYVLWKKGVAFDATMP
jgi:transposase